MSIDIKDVLTGGGIVVTLALGLWNLVLNYRASKQTWFINTVTNERVKWIQEVRANISELSGAIHSWATMYVGNPTTPESTELLERIDRLRYRVRLQLNPIEEPDRQMEKLIQEIPKLTGEPTLDPILEALEKLTRLTQNLLKKEWEKIKTETVGGKIEKPEVVCPAIIPD